MRLGGMGFAFFRRLKMETSAQLLQRIVAASTEVATAKLLTCECSALVIQREGSCQCERGRQVMRATEKLNEAIAAAQRYGGNAEEQFCAACGCSKARHQTAGGFCKHCLCEKFIEKEKQEYNTDMKETQ